MNWNTLTHGTNGFLLGWGLVLVPLWAGLAHGRAPIRVWIFSPVSALAFLLAAGLLNTFAHAFVPDALSTVAAIGSYLLVGYAGGRYLASRPTAGEAHKRGALLNDRRAAPRDRPDAITLAGIEVSALDETKHFKVIGTTGTGKSTAIREVLRTALDRGDRAVIADPDGAYLQHFYDPRRGDEILNPFDPRSVQWDLFAELRAPYDIDQLARALIADSPDASGHEWRAYARTFLASLLRSAHCAHCVGASSKSVSSPADLSPPEPPSPAEPSSAPGTTAHLSGLPAPRPSPNPPGLPTAALPAAGPLDLTELWRRLVIATPQELRGLLAGTPAQAFLAPGNEKMFGSMRSVAISACAALEHIAAQRATPFSIRSWIHPLRGSSSGTNASDPSLNGVSPAARPAARSSGVLFLPYSAGEIATLRTMIATWLRLAIFEAMNGSEGDQRLWFVIDELDALGAIDGLKDALARVRKFGGRCVLGFQSIGQVSALYGRGESQTIVENCGNTLILRCSASEGGGTAQFASRLIGDREIVRTQVSETVSRDGVSFIAPRRKSTTTSLHHSTEPAVLPSEIEQLPDLWGYLKLASRPEWVKVSVG